MKFLLPPAAIEVIEKIESAGFEAWAVGGCVRDLMLGIPISDVDIASNAEPETVRGIFSRVIDTGIKHGTVTVLHGGSSFEITRYRTDGEYSDSRHPQSVSPVSTIYEDLSRRDFTVNAMAYHPSRGTVDLFGGKEDLKNKIIRCVGEPKKRFNEDALRIMRCFRFASKLDFSVEEKTKCTALELADNLEKISVERINKELTATLRGKNPDSILPLLCAGGLSFLNLPQIPESLFALTKLKKDDKTLLSAFLLLCGCDDSTDICQRLKTSKKMRNDVKTVLYDFNFGLCRTDADIKRRLAAYGENLFSVLSIRRYVLGEDTEYAEKRAREIISNGEPYRICDLAINGEQLKEVGVKDAKTGEVLAYLTDEVRKNPELNNSESLLSMVRHRIAEPDMV